MEEALKLYDKALKLNPNNVNLIKTKVIMIKF